MRQEGRPLVVVVDDDENIRTLCTIWLSPCYTVLAFESGEALMVHLENLRPDLAILDIQLGGSSGLEIARRIRARARFKELPILFLSGLRTSLLLEGHVSKPDVSAWLLKPFESRQLLDFVRRLLAAAPR